VTQTFPVRRSAHVARPATPDLYYTPADPTYMPSSVLFTDAGWAVDPIDGFNTNDGAGLCGNPNGALVDGIPGAVGPYISCIDLRLGRKFIFDLFNVTDTTPLPICDSIRATATAVRLTGLSSGDWLMVTAPGEPTAPYAAYLRDQSPAGKDHTLLIGYSDDHAGYLLTAEDWLHGGYEPSINIWGPLEGEIILQGVLAAAKVAWTPAREDPEVGSSRWLDFQFPNTTMVPQLMTSDHGTASMPTMDTWWPDTKGPATLTGAGMVPRIVGAARFAWQGGDPAVDFPEVVIEQETMPNVFAPLLDSRGRPASTQWGAAVITYMPQPLTAMAPTSHQYTVTWQPLPPDPYSLAAPAAPYGLALGRYRFHVKGSALASSGPTTYDLTSPPFTVIAAPLDATSTAMKGATGVDITALLGNAPGLRALRDTSSDQGVPLPGPWAVTVSFSGLPSQMVMVMADATGKGTLPLVAGQLALVTTVDVKDGAGNGGTITVQ
jgi:neutral ceramidase